MKKIGIIICDRYKSCGGGKCFRALRERKGGFSIYSSNEQVDIVGYANCGGCPGGNIEYAPEEFLKNGCDVIHLATGFVVGFPPCPYIKQFKNFIEKRYLLPVIIGTHPIPLSYFERHQQLPFWQESDMGEIAMPLMIEHRSIMESYN